MIVRIISIGDELIHGRTIDTNAAWLARQLSVMGFTCDCHVTLRDDMTSISQAINDAMQAAEIVLVTGGLGPTPDDMTRDALADAMDCELLLHEPSLRQIKRYFDRLSRRMSKSNRRQAMIPESAEPLENTCGTAPGIHAKRHDADIYCLPGVPYEMKAMFERSVRPRLPTMRDRPAQAHHVLRTFGMSESALGENLADLMRRGRNPVVGTSAEEMIISVHIDAVGPTRDDAIHLLDTDVDEIRTRLGDVVFTEPPSVTAGRYGDSLAGAVGRLLIERKQTISTAESCTGGLIAKRLTDVPGSSQYMVQGFVTYANQSKCELLEVPMDMIVAHGAVSPQVARSMAENCRRISNTDYALSATGIAGPSGGSPDKPVGLVYVALATAGETLEKELHLGEHLSRSHIRDRTAKIALNLLRQRLIGHNSC